MGLSYEAWKEYIIVEYDIISKNYNRKIYETVVEDKDTHENKFIQLTLRDTLNMCQGTSLEEPMRKAVMKVIYAGAKLKKEIRKVMDIYYEV